MLIRGTYYKSTIYARPKTLTFLVFLVCVVVTQVIAWRLFERELSIEKDRVEKQLIQFKRQLENILEYSSTATYTLAFLVQNDLLEGNFDSLSDQLLRQNDYIDAMQLVKGTVITKTYPLEGNEAVIGLDISKTPAHIREAREAIEREQLYFEGPFELTQGGIGFVGRLPIIKNGNVWGFSAVVIRLNTLLGGLNIEASGVSDNFIYQLVKVNGDQERSLFQNTEPFSRGIYATENLPQGNWKLYVKLKNPNHWNQFIPFSLLGIIFAVLLAAFIWKVATQPRKLQLLIEEKTKDLKHLNEILERRADELEQYAHVISHDLQEPLRMVVSFLQLLKKRSSEQLDEASLQYVAYSLTSALRMRQLVRDLLEYSLAGKHEFRKEQLPLSMVMDDVISMLQKELEHSRCELQYAELPVVNANKVAMTQVMQNLVNNAVKYVAKDQVPRIEVLAREDEENWEIIIKDNGIGVPKEYHEEIFDIFKRLHSSNEYHGTGLGLAIVKKNVASMGGKVWIESEEGQGSAFHFTLPKS